MKKILIFASIMLTAATSVAAQETRPAENPTPPVQQDDRGAFLREIGLAPDQIRQMRRLNMERKPLMEAAQHRLREANRLLDEAIYADEVNDVDIQSRLKEAQSAQAEVFRIRSMNELAIRRILTPEQLVHFRDLRRQFEAARQDQRDQRRMDKRDQRGMEKGNPNGNGMRPAQRFPRNAATPLVNPNPRKPQ